MKTIRTRIYNELVDDDGKVTTETLELRVVDGCVAGQIKIGNEEQRWADLRNFTTHVPLHCEVLRHLFEALPESTAVRIPEAIRELFIKWNRERSALRPVGAFFPGTPATDHWDLQSCRTLEQEAAVEAAGEFEERCDSPNPPTQEEFDQVHQLLLRALDATDPLLFTWRAINEKRGYWKSPFAKEEP